MTVRRRRLGNHELYAALSAFETLTGLRWHLHLRVVLVILYAVTVMVSGGAVAGHIPRLYPALPEGFCCISLQRRAG